MYKRLLYITCFQSWSRGKDLSFDIKSKINSNCAPKDCNSESISATGILYFIAADNGFNLWSTDL